MLPRGPGRGQSDDDRDDDPDGGSDATDVFDWRERRGDRLELLHHGRVVTTLKGRAAVQLAERLERAGPAERQRLLARETGQYRFGNERAGKIRDKRRGP